MGEDDAGALVCSAKGCRAPAMNALRWNNPKLHVPTARKTWLACDEHLHRLTDFLGSRRLLREVDRLPDLSADPDATVGGVDAVTP